MLTGWGRDLRAAWRTIRRAPRFSMFVVTLLAVGIGGGGALIMLLETLVLRQVPSPYADRLAMIEVVTPAGAHRLMPMPTLDELERRQSAFEMLAGFTPGISLRAEIDGAVIPVAISPVTGNYFDLLGIPAALGRPLTGSDNEINPADSTLPVFISDHFWAEAFEGDGETVGRSFLLDGKQVTVVGVGPPGYKGLSPEGSIDITLPIDVFGQIVGVNDPRVGVRANFTVARLKPGVGLDVARENLAAVWPGARDDTAPPVTPRELTDYLDQQLVLTDFRTGFSQYREEYATPLTILLWLAAVLLALTAANLAGLLIARNAKRATEWRVRRALGAGMRHLVRLSFAEGAIYMTVSVLLAMPVAWWTSRVLVATLWRGSSEPHFYATAGWWTFGAFGASATVVIVVMSLLPAWTAASTGRLSGASTRAIGQPRLMIRTLVVGQLAVSLAVAFAGGLLARNLGQWWGSERGYDPDPVALIYLTTQPGRNDPAAMAASLGPLTEAVRALPGVEAASVSYIFSRLSSSITGSVELRDIEGDRRPLAEVRQERLSPGFFDTIGARVIAGRDFSEADEAGGYRVAILTQRLAETILPDGAVGRRLAIGSSDDPIEIVGVVNDLVPLDPRMEVTDFVFTPLLKDPGFTRVAVVNARTSRPLHTAQVLDLVESTGQYTLLSLTSMNERTGKVLASERVTASLGVAFGVMALLIAGTGLMSLLAYLVEGRRREFGVRLALGARPAGLVWSVLREGCLLLTAGIGIGVPLALGGGRLVGALLQNIQPTDSQALAGGVAVLVVAVLIAAILPARRAARIDPMQALRAD